MVTAEIQAFYTHLACMSHKSVFAQQFFIFSYQYLEPKKSFVEKRASELGSAMLLPRGGGRALYN